MSERSFSGIVAIEDQGPTGMVTVRADLSDENLSQALEGIGASLPEQGAVENDGDVSTLWMSPDELMILCPHETAETRVAAISSSLGGAHALVVNVSDARVIFRLSGTNAAIHEVLAKLTPADLRASALPIARVRRTRFSQVAAAFWFATDEEAFLICFRSVGDYVFGLLSNAAKKGSEVSYF